MDDVHATPLPESLMPSKKGINPLFPIALLFIIALIVGIYYFISPKKTSVLKAFFPQTQNSTNQSVIACPVPQKYCTKAQPFKTYLVKEGSYFSALIYVLPQGVPILAVQDNVDYTAPPLDVPGQPRLLENQTLINADFSKGLKKYQLGYIFEGIPAAQSKSYRLGETIGTIQDPKGNANPEEGSVYTLIFYIKDPVTKKYLEVKQTVDGKTIVAQ